WVDINQLVTQVLKLAGAELRHRAKVELDLRPVPLLKLEANRLTQVLLNLIINAYQAFGERAQSENMLWAGSARDGNTVRLYVADNGPGIPKETQERIWEPFYTTKPVGVGTGLGLAICYDIVQGIGGDIAVESTVGRGTRFTVSFPLKTATRPGLEWQESGQS
ncbi:MAG: hypothetical protein KC561_21655, partial [Myxococcales bacterium]|nr:hypothetical protein [Myxococcales bacterium]